MKTKIARWGNSLAVRLPKKMADESGLAEGADVQLRAQRGHIVIVPRLPQVDFDDIVRRMKGKKPPELWDWGPAVGAEIDL